MAAELYVKAAEELGFTVSDHEAAINLLLGYDKEEACSK